MENKLLLFLLSTKLIIGCENFDDSYLIEFDINKNYPILDIKLSDVAKIGYIELRGDTIPLINEDVSNNIFIGEDFILVGDKNRANSRLIMFDKNGNFMYSIGSYGRGPGEFLRNFTFVVDTFSQNIIVYAIDLKMFIKYDYTGTLINSYPINKRFNHTEIINRNIIGYNYKSEYFNQFSQTIKGDGVSLYAYDSDNFNSIVLSDLKYDRLYNGKIGIINNLTKAKDGAYITSFRSDSIYFIDRYLSLHPRFTNKRYSENISVFPTMETKDYIFFSTESEITVECKRDVFVLRKKDNKIFRVNNSDPLSLNYKKKLINNELSINQFTLTHNHNIAAVMLPYDFLMKNHSTLKGELKIITDKMSENSNPILMLMMFNP